MNRSKSWSVIAAALMMGLALPQWLGAQAPAQGIKVHGHWVIEVRNPDGTLQLHREFENALTDLGKGTLASLLSGQKTFDYWQVVINNLLCVNASQQPTPCLMAEPASPLVFPYLFKNLTKTVVNSTLVLAGSFVAASDGVVSNVNTFTLTLPSTGPSFSSAGLTPIPVQASQTVSVTVTISFS